MMAASAERHTCWNSYLASHNMMARHQIVVSSCSIASYVQLTNMRTFIAVRQVQCYSCTIAHKADLLRFVTAVGCSIPQLHSISKARYQMCAQLRTF